MSITGKTKEGAGYIEEETGELLKNKKMAYRGRELRNEGRVEDGKGVAGVGAPDAAQVPGTHQVRYEPGT